MLDLEQNEPVEISFSPTIFYFLNTTQILGVSEDALVNYSVEKFNTNIQYEISNGQHTFSSSSVSSSSSNALALSFWNSHYVDLTFSKNSSSHVQFNLRWEC